MLGDWRKKLEDAKATGEWLERVAEHFGIEDLPLTMHPYGTLYPAFSWDEWGEEDLASAGRRIRQVIFATKTNPDSTDAYVDDGLPVVTAWWDLELPQHLVRKVPQSTSIKIRVGGWNIRGCQIVHKGQKVTRQETALSTECVQVVQNWEDIDPAECAAS